jgi:multiple sugar transport system substrate-binding protein
MYQPVDDFIDFSRPEWDATRDIMELFEWGGRNYTAITELTNSTAMLFYRNSVAQDAGLRDPYEVWRLGEWTWDVMTDMLEQFSVRDQKWGIMGFLIDEAAILSTGIGMISIEDGILRNNLDDRRIERAMGMLQTIAENDYRFPYHILSDYSLDHTEFRNGNVLFTQDGPWRYQETYTRQRASENWADDEIRIVPFPRDPEAHRHYLRGKQDAMMFVVGSTNRDGFLAWTYSALLAHQDNGMRLQSRERDIANHHWTEHQLNVLEELRSPEHFTLVWDFKNGIGPDLGREDGSPVEDLHKPVIVLGESFAAQREENRPPIEHRINEINEAILEQMAAAE